MKRSPYSIQVLLLKTLDFVSRDMTLTNLAKKMGCFPVAEKKVIFNVLKLFFNLNKFHILAFCVWSQKDTSTFFSVLLFLYFATQ